MFNEKTKTMNNIKTVFSIKDLENLSGIKAHTIRIWEKRYNILEPMRTDTNIRLYDSKNLQKLLNIVLLHKYGYKISKISKYSEEEIPKLVREIISEKSVKNHAISEFKLAMMNFDQNQFQETYTTLLSEKSFRDVFYEIFIPLMEEIGVLWQSDTITPAHEHFISHLLRQKIILHTEKAQTETKVTNETVFVLYLPMNEIHELGLLYLNYELISNGCHTVYLGESVPLENLKDVQKYFKDSTFVSYITVEPDKDAVNDYIKKIQEELLDNSNSKLWLLGRMTSYIETENLPKNITIFNSIAEIVHAL